MNPRIVVGMGCFNEAPYLDETIPAVLAQTMPDFALAILDNGSTDGSGEILRRYAALDSRIVVRYSPSNLIPPRACNGQMAFYARRWPDWRWCLGAGADDVMAPDYLEAILAVADEQQYDPKCDSVNLIQSPRQWIDHPERGVKPWPAYNPATIHAEPQISGWRAVTRELWDAVGPEDESIIIGADWDWAVRASVAGVLRPYQLERPYIGLRVRDGARKSQSDEVDWPALHRHLCGVTGNPVPAWAR